MAVGRNLLNDFLLRKGTVSHGTTSNAIKNNFWFFIIPPLKEMYFIGFNLILLHELQLYTIRDIIGLIVHAHIINS
jgi:hypothetical protein